MQQHNCLANNKYAVLFWDNANILLKKVSLKMLPSHAEFLLLFLNWQYTWLSPSFSMRSKSRCIQQETFLISDQHIEIFTLHAYRRPAVSPKKDTLPWLKLPWTDLITSHRLETWIYFNASCNFQQLYFETIQNDHAC